VSNIELPVLRRHAMDDNRRLRRVVPLIAVGALCASLLAGATGPASAAVAEPARTAPIALASSDNDLAAASLATAERYVHVSDSRSALEAIEAIGAKKAEVSSQARSTESAHMAGPAQAVDRRTATVRNTPGGGVVVDVAKAAPAAAQNRTITVLPGITLTITSTEIQLNMTKQAVTEIENLAGFGQSVASLVGAILGVIPPTASYSGIAGIVAASLGLGSSFLRLCSAPDGSATFTIPFPGYGLPSCSGLSIAGLV
jgi:hypothetical protein